MADAAGKIVEADKVGSIEQHDIRPIPLSDRHGSAKDLTRMWFGANTNYVVLLTGTVPITMGLGLWDSVLAVLLGNILGCIVLGLSSIMGPRTGSAGIICSRTALGQAGSFLPVFISTLSVLGWFSINSVVATDGLKQIIVTFGAGDTHILMWICLAVVLAGEILLAIYGHATIIAAEKYMAVILGLLFVGLLFFVVPHVDWNWGTSIKEGPGVSVTGTWLAAMGIIFAYPISWTNFASDYSRYLDPDTEWKEVAFYAGLGQFLALTFCELIGVLFAVAVKGALGADPVAKLTSVLPTWYLVPFLIAVMLGSIATNVPNGYTAGLGILSLRIPLSRVQSILLIGAFTLVFRILTLLYGHFFDLYQQWLTYIIIWTCPWVAIVVLDYFMRKGNYVAKDLMKWKEGEYWYNGGVFLPGVIAFIVGLGVAILFSNSSMYTSPLMTKYFGGADLSFEVGILVAGLLYWLLAKGHDTFKRARALNGSVWE